MKHEKEIFHFAGEKEQVVYLPPPNWNMYGLKWPEPPNANVGMEPS